MRPASDPRTWESAVVIRVPSLDPTLTTIRERFDLPRKPNGIPAHVTLVVPFLPASELDRALVELRAICAEVEPFEVRFTRTARFPRVLYLEPEPASVFVELTAAITNHWPRLEPYGGAHRHVVPHLTVTTSSRASTLTRVEPAAQASLPHVASITAAQLYRFDGRRWTEQTVLPLGSSTPPSTEPGRLLRIS